MRELHGQYLSTIQSVLDVSPDMWMCIYDEATAKPWLLGPEKNEKILLRLNPNTTENMKTIAIESATIVTARFHPISGANSTYDVAVGYSNGYVCVFNRSGEELFALQCHVGHICRLEWNFHSTKQGGRELHVLFSDMTLVVIEWEMDPIPKRFWRKYSLNGQRDIIAVLPCGDLRTTLFQTQPRAGIQPLIAVGCDPVVGFYHAGHEGTSLFRIAHLASAVATRAAGAVWSLARNWGWPQDKESETAEAVPSDVGIHVALGMPDASRRRARDLILSPNGKLALIPDTLGRILLIDTTTMVMIRLWKGYRDAQCGWMTQDGTERGLYMVFYSGRRGLIEIWRARYGPRVTCHPVGVQARLKLSTIVSKSVTKCIATHEKTDGTLTNFEVELDSNSTSTILQYFSQANKEEETYMLHQLIDSLPACASDKMKQTRLLEKLKQLTTLTAIKSFDGALCSPAIDGMSAVYLRDVFRALAEVRQRSMKDEVNAGTKFANSVFLFQVEWKAFILEGFIELSQEVVSKPFQSLFEEDQILIRMNRWRKVYAVEPKATSSQLSWLEFLECFETPWLKSLTPEQELTLGVILQKHFRNEISFAETHDQVFSLLHASILRPDLSNDIESNLATFCFAPLHGAVFVVQHVQEIHRRLRLDHDQKRYISFFLRWYFSLSLDQIFTMTSTNASSSLQRWIQPWIQSSLYPHSIDETSFFLPELHPSLARIFDACQETPYLLHAFVLSNHIGVGLLQHANTLQDNTLGDLSATGADLAWKVLENCLSQCLYFSCLLKVPGKLDVKSIESMDELMKYIAVIHLNTSEENSDTIQYDWDDNWIDQWNETSMKHDVVSVLKSFPQLNHSESLVCFRAIMLCTAWNKDRSRMHYLELAIDELENSDTVQLALIEYLWEFYLKNQVASIMKYWIDLKSNEKNGIDQSIAGQFLRIVQQLLELLLETCRTMKSIPILPPKEIDGLELAQLQEHIVWTGTPLDVLTLYRSTWPPSPTKSTLIKLLTTVETSSVMESAVILHHQLVSVLIAFNEYTTTAKPLASLFSISELCNSKSLRKQSSTTLYDAKRYEFVMDVLRQDVKIGMGVATAFQLPLDRVKQDHAVWLYQSGNDAHAEEILDKVLVEQNIIIRLGRVARTRLALVISRMQSRSEYAALMSQVPADISAWICSNEGPLQQDPEVAHLDSIPSLTATNTLLHQCLQWMTPTSVEFKRCHGMIRVVERLLEQLKRK